MSQQDFERLGYLHQQHDLKVADVLANAASYRALKALLETDGPPIDDDAPDSDERPDEDEEYPADPEWDEDHEFERPDDGGWR